MRYEQYSSLIAEFDCRVLFSRPGAETPAAGILEYGPPGYPSVGSVQAVAAVAGLHSWRHVYNCTVGPTVQLAVLYCWFREEQKKNHRNRGMETVQEIVQKWRSGASEPTPVS